MLLDRHGDAQSYQGDWAYSTCVLGLTIVSYVVKLLLHTFCTCADRSVIFFNLLIKYNDLNVSEVILGQDALTSIAYSSSWRHIYTNTSSSTAEGCVLVAQHVCVRKV